MKIRRSQLPRTRRLIKSTVGPDSCKRVGPWWVGPYRAETIAIPPLAPLFGPAGPCGERAAASYPFYLASTTDPRCSGSGLFQPVASQGLALRGAHEPRTGSRDFLGSGLARSGPPAARGSRVLAPGTRRVHGVQEGGPVALVPPPRSGPRSRAARFRGLGAARNLWRGRGSAGVAGRVTARTPGSE